MTVSTMLFAFPTIASFLNFEQFNHGIDLLIDYCLLHKIKMKMQQLHRTQSSVADIEKQELPSYNRVLGKSANTVCRPHLRVFSERVFGDRRKIDRRPRTLWYLNEIRAQIQSTLIFECPEFFSKQ